uniref:Cytochrome b6/f complex subunit VI n=1 Tax=Macrostomum lignano TaxID=282301 RepID=A0A1I8FVP5_9PLAT
MTLFLAVTSPLLALTSRLKLLK